MIIMEQSFISKPSVSFEVERILGISSDGHYQVQWAPAWVSKFHLVGCDHLIQEFLQQTAEKTLQCQQTERVQQPQPVKETLSDSCPVTSNVLVSANVTHSQQAEVNPEQSMNLALFADHAQSKNDLCTHPDDNLKSEMFSSENDEPANSFDFNPDPVDRGFKIKEEDTEDLSSETTYVLLNDMSFPFDGHDGGGSMDSDNSTTSATAHTVTSDKYNDSITFLQSHGTPNSKYICSVCQKDCIDSSRLRLHFRTHTGIRPYVCKYCSKAFAHNGNLNQHLRTHTGERPFPCEQCGKSFTRKSDLDRHARLHTGLKPYQCENCEKSFSDSSTRNKHMRLCSTSKQELSSMAFP